MENRAKIRWAGYGICLGLCLALVVYAVFDVFPPETDRYISVHEASEIPPLMGLAVDSLVNTGDAKALDTLPGVGKVISQRIIDIREMIGGFRLPEDLMLVKGIGEKTFAGIMEALDEPLIQLPEITK